MKVLFDTNIFITLETPGVVLPETFSDMVRFARELHYDIFYHPAQIEDLKRDKNDTRRTAQLSRLRQYPALDNPPSITDSELKALGWRQNNDHDRVDNLLLFALKRGAVSFLVTEDRDVHRKASSSGLSDRVFFVEDFLAYLRNAKGSVGTTAAAYDQVECKYLYEIDIENVFFNSLRKGYDGFNDWYRKCSEQDRQAWIIHSENTIRALCVFKEEFNERVTSSDEILRGKILKLCTFKVADLGKKYGERLLFVAFNHAVKTNCDYVYLQVREEDHGYLLSLLTDFGFAKFGEYNDDATYVKDMRVGVRKGSVDRNDYVQYAIAHYPHVIDEGVKKYIVPIRPSYHDLLFPDKKPYQDLFQSDLSSESNAIKKAYLCKSPIKDIRPGDLLFFYRSKDEHRICCVGVAEKIRRFSDADDLIGFVSKRTVYTHDEMRKFTSRGEVLAILFRLIRYLKSPVEKKTLTDRGVKGQIQTIREMPESVYRELFKKDVGI